MRILHINCNYIGTTLHQSMVEMLDKMEYQNTVYVPTYCKKNAVIIPNNNVYVSECFKKWNRIIFDYKQSKILCDIREKIDISNFDCIHAYTLFTDGNIARQLSRQYGIPYVVAVRNTDVNAFFRLKPYLRTRGIQIMREAEAVCFLSPSYQKQVFKKYIPKKWHQEIFQKSYVVPNGIDSFWFENLLVHRRNLIDPKKIKLIYAGRIDKNKNIVAIQKAMTLLRKKGYQIHLTVVGKIGDQSVFKRIIRDTTTQYISSCPKEQLIDLYRANDIFVMPSFHESFGLVYVEAMSQGLPVIYTKGQGFDGQFEEGTVGYSVTAKSAREIAKAIEKIANEYEHIADGLPEKTKRYQWQNLCVTYSEIYEKIGTKHG